MFSVNSVAKDFAFVRRVVRAVVVKVRACRDEEWNRPQRHNGTTGGSGVGDWGLGIGVHGFSFSVFSRISVAKDFAFVLRDLAAVVVKVRA